jgi:hypothetical protein
MTDEAKRRHRWINIGCMFEQDVDGHKVITGGLFGRQCVAVLGESREGEPMWLMNLMNVGRDHDAALDLARWLISKNEEARIEPRKKRPTLKLNPPPETEA